MATLGSYPIYWHCCEEGKIASRRWWTIIPQTVGDDGLLRIALFFALLKFEMLLLLHVASIVAGMLK